MTSFTRVSNVLINGLLILLSVVCLFPVFYAIMVSLHPSGTGLASIIPREWYFGHYVRLFTIGIFPRYILNSVINALGGALLSTALAAVAAYAFARMQFRGKSVMLAYVYGMMMLPGLVAIIPLYKLASDLKLLNTYALLIMVFGAYGVPLSIWILKGFFESIPLVLEEAAAIDGATPVQTFFLIVLPLTTPGLIATLLIDFVYSWNNFFTPLVLTTKTEMKMATVGLFDFQHVLEGTQDELLAAACVVIMVPAIVLFLIMREYFMRGMVEGAVKG